LQKPSFSYAYITQLTLILHEIRHKVGFHIAQQCTQQNQGKSTFGAISWYIFELLGS
jgi:hypothetical protein